MGDYANGGLSGTRLAAAPTTQPGASNGNGDPSDQSGSMNGMDGISGMSGMGGMSTTP